MLFLDCDGTFNIPQINKPDNPNEESLNSGCAFVVKEHEYQRYLSHMENDLLDVSAQFEVVFMLANAYGRNVTAQSFWH